MSGVNYEVEANFVFGVNYEVEANLVFGVSQDIKTNLMFGSSFRAQELFESRGGCPVPNSPYGLRGRKSTLNSNPGLAKRLKLS